MRIIRHEPVLLSVIFILLVSLYACDSAKQPERGKMSKDLRLLSKIITIPIQPEDAWWQEIEMGTTGRSDLGPRDRSFVAVIRFKVHDVESIISKSKIASDGVVRLDKSMAFNWYPAELKNMIKPLPDGSFYIQSTVFEPTMFIAKSSYTSGYMLKISEDKIFLSLSTM